MEKNPNPKAIQVCIPTQVYKYFKVGGYEYSIRVWESVNYIAKDESGLVWGYNQEPYIDRDEDDTLWLVNENEPDELQSLGTVESLERISWSESRRRLY
jgi:hypothetical protein